MTTDQLTELIKTETSAMFEKYLNMRVEWDGRVWDNFMKWTPKTILEAFGIRKETIDYWTKETRTWYSRTRKSEAMEAELRHMTKLGREGYIAKMQANHKMVYRHATAKLAHRIVKKGMNLDNMKTESIGFKEGDLQTTFTDGIVTVRAFTILAWGEINAPHYRYLVK